MQTATTCLFCGHHVLMIHVHGHYQCPVCNTNAMPCCDGDNCDTNKFFAEQMNPAAEINCSTAFESAKAVSNEQGF